MIQGWLFTSGDFDAGPLWESFEGDGISGYRVGDQLRVKFPCLEVQVVDGITDLVIARVIPLPRSTTKLRGLFFSLHSFCACCNTATWNSVLDESIIVAATIKRNVCVVLTMCFVVFGIQVSKLLGSGRVDGVPCVVDLIGKVWRSEHVVVHKESDLQVFFLGKLGNVVIRSKQALLFSSPPRKTDAILDAVIWQVGGDFEETYSP